MTKDLVRRRSPEEKELDEKLAELAELEQQLTERELQLATMTSELHEFDMRYRATMGPLFAKLDELRAQIAEVKLQDEPDNIDARRQASAARRAAEESARAAEDAPRDADTRPHFQPSEDLKKLYRDVARAVHPDLAEGEDQRDRRTHFMAKANAAYEAGDEEKLRSILHDWESDPESIVGDDAGSQLIRAIRKLARVRVRLEAIAIEISELERSPLFALKQQIADAASDGRDLLAEMASALEVDIQKATTELMGLNRD